MFSPAAHMYDMEDTFGSDTIDESGYIGPDGVTHTYAPHDAR